MQIIKVQKPNSEEVVDLIVDDWAYELLKNKKINLYGSTERRPYARVGIYGHWIPIHHLLINGDCQVVDHINGNQLDNRIENLRAATPITNSVNRRKPFYKNRAVTSLYKGVHKKAPNKKWSAAIYHEGTSYHLGYFKDEIEAAKAYDEKARELFGEFAHLNFK